MRTVFLGTSRVRGRRARAPGRRATHRPALVLTRPDRPRGPWRASSRHPVAERARALGIALEQPESVNEPAARELIAQRAPEACDRVRVRRADQGAAALRARAPERAPVAAAALARRRADRARDHGRRRAHRRLDHAPHRRSGQRAGVPRRRSEPIARKTPTGRSPTRLQALGGELLVRALDLSRAASRRRSPSRTRRASPTPRRSAPRTVCSIPQQTGGRAGARRAGAAPPHRRARVALADGTLLGVHRARDAAERTPVGALSAVDGDGCCTALATGRSSCWRCNRRAGARWTRLPTCVDMPAKAASARTRSCAACSRTAPTPTGAARGGEAARPARSGAGDAPGLRCGAAQGHARST